MRYFTHWLPSTVYWLLLVTWAVLITWLSSLTSGEMPSLLGSFWDKLLHAGAYGLLTLFFLLAVHGGFCRPTSPRLLLAGFLLALFYGLADEWHQSMVPTRVASLADLLADGFGGLAALPLYAVLSRVVRRSEDVS